MEIEQMMTVVGPEPIRRSAFFLGAAWALNVFASLEPLMSDECAQKAKELVLKIQELEKTHNPVR